MRARITFTVSCVVHVLLGVALSAAVWRAAPQQPAPSAVSVVFAAPVDQQETTKSQPVPAVAEPSQPGPVLPEPVASAPSGEADATPVLPLPEPVRETAATPLPDPVEQAAPILPAPEPAPEPPSPPPPIVQAPPLQPPPAPHSKPPAKQIAARSQVAKPAPGLAATAPTEPVASASPTVAQSQSPAVAGWNTLFSAWLAARKTYPDAARRQGEQGSVTLRFRVAVDGTVLEVSLVTGSGSPVLDEAARALLRNAKLPPPQTEISRTVRLRYRLDD